MNASLFKRTLDNLPDGVLLVSQDRKVLYANPAFATVWRAPADLDRNDYAAFFEYACSNTQDPEAFRSRIAGLYFSEEASEDEIVLKDGRILSRRSVPFFDEAIGRARIWILTDITEAAHAQIDTLTGLPNRRAYAKQFPLIAAQEDGLVSAVAIMDVDNFKPYNDLYGHAAGDRVLRTIGKILSSQLRHEDTAFRIGGEEFLVACRTRSDQGARGFFERIRTAIEEEAIEHNGNSPFNVVTASMGFAIYRGAQDPARLFELADQALYASKASGRNRVTQAGPVALAR